MPPLSGIDDNAEKLLGNKAFLANDFPGAIAHYTLAIDGAPSPQPAYLSADIYWCRALARQRLATRTALSGAVEGISSRFPRPPPAGLPAD